MGEQELGLESVQPVTTFNHHGTCQQWLQWLKEQVAYVADQMDEEQRQRGNQEERLQTTTKELEKVRAQMRGLEEELMKAKETRPAWPIWPKIQGWKRNR